MANYYWVGSGSDTAYRYDWNTASNWKVEVQQGTRSVVQTATSAPGAGDTVYIGDLPYGVPCYSPLLFGGFSGGVQGGTWLNSAGGAGHTFNSALSEIHASVGNASYPYAYLGGGLTGAIYDWVMSLGVTFGGMSGENIDINLADSRVADLTLKVKTVETEIANPYAFVGFNFVDSLNQLGGGTGATSGTGNAATAPIANNTLNAISDGALSVKGGLWDTIEINPNYSAGITNSHPRTLVSSVVCRELKTKSHSFMIDSSVTAGKAHVDGGSYAPFYRMIFKGNVDMQYVLGKYMPASSLTGSVNPGDSTLVLDNPTSMNFRFPYATITLGDHINGSAMKAGSVVVNSNNEYSNGPEYQVPWSVEFGGSALINELHSNYSHISASPSIRTNAVVTVGTLYLDRMSVLDFAANPKFDNWILGTDSASAGGIIFRDEGSHVVGSKGMRLWTSQLNVGERYDTRLSTLSKDPIKGTLPTAPEAI